MSELTNLVAKQNEESYQLGKKHGAIEKLEKIKAELEKTYPMNGYGIPSSRATGKSAGYGLHIALEIIDKHISELKGEKMDKPKCCWKCEHLIPCNPEEDKCKLDGHIFKDRFCLSTMRDKECPLDIAELKGENK